MTDSTGSLSELIAERQRATTPIALPVVSYDRDGDCMELLFEDANYVGVRLDGSLTLYVSADDTRRPVGLVFKGVMAYIRERAPGFDLSDPIRVRDLLHFYRWATKWTQDEQLRQYELVRRKASAANPRVLIGS